MFQHLQEEVNKAKVLQDGKEQSEAQLRDRESKVGWPLDSRLIATYLD